ncbi:MAG TPA: FAD-dependent oxidoreductase [Solirubrobacteraceae bacterium]|jgi:glycine/D-amino acid oxidase-like deaminating enzyme|nr:FAD-dependent oxidoreductase [Solirubrobacteraceae bacterium]
MVDVDVLIIGGGAQGLWVLNDLTKRHYRTVLLERGELGGGQTCHSHGLIHRGHYYDDVDMMIVLNAAAQFWEAFVDERGISRLNPSRALAGFGPGTTVSRHTYFWKTAGLHFDPCPALPPVLEGSRVRHLFETEEFSLDPSEIIAGFAADLDHATYKLQSSDDALEFVTNGNSIERVQAKLEGQQVEFAPKYLVMCAGVGNYGLLAKLGRDVNPGGSIPVQAQRKNHMMVLRGDNLPMMTAVFPIRGGLQGVFLCPREDPSTGQPVWLASDHNSLPFPMTPQGHSQVDSLPSGDWVRRMLISLRGTAPALFADGDVDGLEMAVYTGPTSERNFGVGQHMTDLFIDPFGFENALTIWPTKLTMTPFASNVVTRFVRTRVAEPGGEWPRVARDITAPPPAVSQEMWCRAPFQAPHESKTQWMPYADFMDTWRL